MPNIPVYTQETEPGYGGGGVRISAPTIQPVDIATPLERLGDQLSDIWAVQAQHQAALDLVKQSSSYQAQAAGAEVAASQLPGAQMAPAYQAATEGIIRKMIADPANQHIAEPLETELRRQQGDAVASMALQGAAATVKDHAIALDAQSTTSAALVASASDPTAASAARQNYYNAVDSLFPPAAKPNENEAYKAGFEHQVQIQTIGRQLVTDPSAANAALLKPDFLETHPGITPEEWQGLRTQAVTQSEFGSRQIDAAMKMTQANNENALTQQEAAGIPIGDALERLRSFGGVSEDFYVAHAGHPYRANMPSAPGLKDSFTQSINDATPDEINHITENIDQARAVGTLSPGDASTLKLMSQHRASELKIPQKAAFATGKAQLIEDIYAPKSKLTGMSNPMAVILPRENFDAYWEGAMARYPTDPQAAINETRDHFKQFLTTAPVGADSFRRLLGK